MIETQSADPVPAIGAHRLECFVGGLHFSCGFGLLWVRAGIMLRAPVIEPRRAYRCSGEAPLAYRESLVWANATAQSRHPKGWRPFLLAHINQFPRTVIVQLRGIAVPTENVALVLVNGINYLVTLKVQELNVFPSTIVFVKPNLVRVLDAGLHLRVFFQAIFHVLLSSSLFVDVLVGSLVDGEGLAQGVFDGIALADDFAGFIG